MTQTAQNDALERYLAFCKNPLRTDAVVEKEFTKLLSLPQIVGLGYKDPHTMIIGTSMISLRDPDSGDIRDVGEFLIHFYRERYGKVWQTGFAFENVTRKVPGPHGTYHHPHISERDIPGIGHLGILCIQRGHFHIYQHLRSGEIHLATELTLGILNTYNKQGPYVPLFNWPRQKGTFKWS